MTTPVDQQAIQSEISNLLGSSEDNLIEQLGIRKFAVTKEPALESDIALRPTFDAQAMGPLDGVKALGRAVLVRWAKELQQLICGTDAASAADRAKLIDAFSASKVVGGVMLASGLIAIGCPAALAPIIAAIVISRFVGSAVEVFCEKSKVWVDELT
ncbi:hypothetical protein LPW26_05305 [Rhodopseudomonas sp. HC1]|uniref:hypothetical protein n=1 Tax=Rhodopseudomonas infernalis TaxID=2897386 RepID=UPI001EE93B20|nr:hypothetical protein [Rhodopseudomonas infernalis]MCG6204043.1 hypothetical protein [Rhodopseudomonas infernalis]